MPKYMVVTYGDGETWATFFDDLNKAEEYRSTGSCCLGYYAEVYERTETGCGSEYIFIYA